MAALFDVLCHADDADLYYVTDERPGITRRRRGRGFSYHRSRTTTPTAPRSAPRSGSASTAS
jgi:DNA topoisomerase IB